jgi:hypothetical protein
LIMMHKMMTREMRKVTGGRARVSAVAAVVGFLAVATQSSADTLASALLLSGNASLLDCFVTNVGSKDVAVSSVKIFNFLGQSIPLASESCLPSIPAGGTCSFSAPADDGRGVVKVDNARTLRGQCQLTDAGNNIRATTDLR